MIEINFIANVFENLWSIIACFEFVDLVRLSVSISRGNFGCLTISFKIYLEHFIE